jgi:hypothetical protein
MKTPGINHDAPCAQREEALENSAWGTEANKSVFVSTPARLQAASLDTATG